MLHCIALYCSLLDRVRDLTEKKGLPTDPYCDETGAAFYRLPAGVRRAQRQKQKQDDGKCLSHNIVTQHNIKLFLLNPMVRSEFKAIQCNVLSSVSLNGSGS